jgi:hypothetical protein
LPRFWSCFLHLNIKPENINWKTADFIEGLYLTQQEQLGGSSPLLSQPGKPLIQKLLQFQANLSGKRGLAN